MNIAIDAFPLSEKASSGIPNYIRHVVINLLNNDKKNYYFAYLKKCLSFSGGERFKVRCRMHEESAIPSFENTLWLFSKGVQMMKDDEIDIFWGTRQMMPPYLPSRVKKVLTVYDLVWHYYPETMDWYNLLVSKLIFKRSIKSADHIITISEATASALGEILNVPADKITVAYPAADGYTPLDKVASSEYISQKYGVNKNYMLTVSTVEPRKNLITLLNVFAKLKSSDFQLLIAGASGWKTSAIYLRYKELGLSENEVKFLGYVPDEDMNRLYSGARLFVFPSVYEGFGIPPLEAMASGTPVIVSNSSSLPEVVGDAGVLLDPYDADAWRAAISVIMSDIYMQDEMIEKGLKRAGLFSWESSVRKTLMIFERLFV